MKCTACFDTAKTYFLGFMRGASVDAAKKYFAAGSCNAHTVGMCMMLHKHLSCNYTWFKADNKIEFSDRSDKGKPGFRKGVYDNMRGFCAGFKGTMLELVKVDGRVQCLKPLND